MSIGPIEMIVCRFEEHEPNGQLVRQLSEIQETGAIRIVDVLFVRVDDVGSLTLMNMKGVGPSDEIEYGSAIAPLLGKERKGKVGLAAEISYGMSQDDLQETVDQLEPGEAAALFMVEHSWAAGLWDAISKTGGELTAHGFLTNGAMQEVSEELEGRIKALDAVDKSVKNQREQAMEVLASAAAARAMQEEVAMRAAEMMYEEKIIEGDVLDDAVTIIAEAIRIEELLNEQTSSG